MASFLDRRVMVQLSGCARIADQFTHAVKIKFAHDIGAGSLGCLNADPK